MHRKVVDRLWVRCCLEEVGGDCIVLSVDAPVCTVVQEQSTRLRILSICPTVLVVLPSMDSVVEFACEVLVVFKLVVGNADRIYRGMHVGRMISTSPSC